MGRFVTAGSATSTIVLGRGVANTNRLVNNIASSLMVGFNSTIPTLFVGPSSGVGTTGNVGIGTSSPEATLEVKGTVKMFGSWASKINSTVYKAASDGFVCVINTALNTYVRGYTDGNNPPVTMRAWESTWYAAYASFMMPVRKGDYWRVTGATTVYWIPLGS